ncbi:MAG: hypothetical protein ACXW04_11795 [Methylobacter sp.]
MTQMHQVTLERIAFGDLDHDGLNNAAVILMAERRFGKRPRHLVAMLNTGNAPRQQDSVLRGDRVQINALSIASGEVNIQMITAGSRDPAGCPTQQVKQTYVLRDGK